MKGIAVLGSTGSIGQNALDVIKRLPGEFKAVALSANSDTDTLLRQAEEMRPAFVCLNDAQAALSLKLKLKSTATEVLNGRNGLRKILSCSRINKVVLAISGSAALGPLLQAIESGKEVALANKEALVMAGSVIMRKAKNNKVKIIPIDSEQSAIWQCLEGQEREKLSKVYLTASGGPFLLTPKSKFRDISVGSTLKHPRWKMGRKISVDSATLMNKGLELLEAMYLFGLSAEKIKIVIHPEAVVHSMVEFIDGSILAQMSVADMRIPIQYALSYPKRLKGGSAGVDLYKLGSLNFQKPDFKKFPCLELAYQAAVKLGTSPCALNASNEVAVEEFLKGRLSFISIPSVIRVVLDKHRNITSPDLGDILSTDAWARKEAYIAAERFA